MLLMIIIISVDLIMQFYNRNNMKNNIDFDVASNNKMTFKEMIKCQY